MSAGKLADWFHADGEQVYGLTIEDFDVFRRLAMFIADRSHSARNQFVVRFNFDSNCVTDLELIRHCLRDVHLDFDG